MTFAFGDHVLDVGRRELRRAGNAVAVEPRTFDLLLYLVRHRDRVVSKADLIESVWGGRIVSDAALTTRINVARKAIGDSGAAQSLIRTIHRKGVRFIGEVRETAATPIHSAADALSSPPSRNTEGEAERHAKKTDDHTSSLSSPDKPSVAILPFVNLSADPEQDYFADGMVEEIITALSRVRWLFVTARTSTLAYKGQAVDMRQVGRELGVRYLLEGSVRKAGDRVRITAQLIEAETGAHVWADRYDRDLTDIFAIQDEITDVLVTAIAPAMSQAEQSRALRKPPESLGAWEAYHRGLAESTSASDSGIATARALFERAVELDPHFAPAHAMLGHITLNETSRGNRPVDQGVKLAERHARRAIELDPSETRGHCVLSWAATWTSDLTAAVDHAERAVAAGPSDSLAHVVKARALLMLGRPAEAGPLLRTALRLSPHDPITRLALQMCTVAAYQQRDYVKAISIARKCIAEFPAYPFAYVWLAAALAQTEQIEEAKAALSRATEIAPSVIEAEVSRRKGFRSDDQENLLDGLRRAGWEG